MGKTTAAAFNEACASLRVDHQQCTVDLAQLSDLHDESSVGSATLVSSLRKETQEAREELEKVFFLRTVNRNAWVYSMDVRMTRNEEKKKKLLFQLDFLYSLLSSHLSSRRHRFSFSSFSLMSASVLAIHSFGAVNIYIRSSRAPRTRTT